MYPSDPDERVQVDIMLYATEWMFDEIIGYLVCIIFHSFLFCKLTQKSGKDNNFFQIFLFKMFDKCLKMRRQQASVSSGVFQKQAHSLDAFYV